MTQELEHYNKGYNTDEFSNLFPSNEDLDRLIKITDGLKSELNEEFSKLDTKDKRNALNSSERNNIINNVSNLINQYEQTNQKVISLVKDDLVKIKRYSIAFTPDISRLEEIANEYKEEEAVNTDDNDLYGVQDYDPSIPHQ